MMSSCLILLIQQDLFRSPRNLHLQEPGGLWETSSKSPANPPWAEPFSDRICGWWPLTSPAPSIPGNARVQTCGMLGPGAQWV